MKKIFVLLVAIIGLGISANAQMCEITGNVEVVDLKKFDETVIFDLKNHNSYKVTVIACITYKDKKVSSVTSPMVIEAGKTKYGISISHWANKTGFKKDYLSVKLRVTKCD